MNLTPFSSSLLYLKRLPATELKIDRGFVRELREAGADAAIVTSILAWRARKKRPACRSALQALSMVPEIGIEPTT